MKSVLLFWFAKNRVGPYNKKLSCLRLKHLIQTVPLVNHYKHFNFNSLKILEY